MKIEQLQEGVLCSLKIGRWNASAKIDPTIMGKNVPKEILRTMQDMVTDKTILKEIGNVRNTTNYALKMNSITFPVEELRFVPKYKIDDLNTLFTEKKREHKRLVEKLIRNMDKLKRKFQRQYPEHFELIRTKYPTDDQLRAKFHFSWNFFQMTLPDENAGILEPSVYKREAKKLQGIVKEMENMTINMVGNLLHEKIKRLETQCDDGNINAATVRSIENFLDKWNDLWSGHIDERKFRSIVSSVRKQMKTTSAEVLKENSEVREALGAKLGKIIGRIENVKAVDLKRRLVI
jgi:hypothetical protein